MTSQLPCFLWGFCYWQLKKRNQKWGSCDVVKILLSSWWVRWLYQCSEHAIFMYWTCNAMNNHFSYCGLVDARISDSEKDLPVFVVDFLSLKPYWEATFPPNHFSLYSNINKLIVHNEVTSKSAEKWPNVWPSINQNLKNQRPRTFYTHFNGSLALLFRT